MKKSDAFHRSFYQVSRHDQFERKNGGGFDAAEFEAHPERYVSNFAKKFAPYASVIVNGIYWDGAHLISFMTFTNIILSRPAQNASQLTAIYRDIFLTKLGPPQNIDFVIVCFGMIENPTTGRTTPHGS